MPSAKQKYQILRRVARGIIAAGVVHSILSVVLGALSLPSIIQHDTTGWLTFLSILVAYLTFVIGMVVAAGGQLLIVFVDMADSVVEIKLNTDELSDMAFERLDRKPIAANVTDVLTRQEVTGGLKEEMFQLEIDHVKGLISQLDYEKRKAALVQKLY